MNAHQLLARHRVARRFSVGDGVRLSDGRGGVVRGHDGDCGYCVAIDGQTQWLHVLDCQLTSAPDLNAGKYGGPSRGGAPGGYVGGNHYRR